MYRPHLLTWLLLAGAAPGSECSLSTSPDGFCAAIHLDPKRVELPIGGTLEIKTTGLNCTSGPDCVDCARHRSRVRWVSSAPDVVAVDSTGLVHAKRMGTADIHLESEESVPQLLASMRVIVGK